MDNIYYRVNKANKILDIVVLDWQCSFELNSLFTKHFQLFGRTIKCSIAKDNGRATEFIRKKVYPDKSKCYECGVRIHSFLCRYRLFIFTKHVQLIFYVGHLQVGSVTNKLANPLNWSYYPPFLWYHYIQAFMSIF